LGFRLKLGDDCGWCYGGDVSCVVHKAVSGFMVVTQGSALWKTLLGTLLTPEDRLIQQQLITLHIS
jgi:hypothetical protein